MSDTFITAEEGAVIRRTEADAIVDAAAEPVILDPVIEDGVETTPVVVPEGWSVQHDSRRVGPPRMKHRVEVRTAGGFESELRRLAGERTPVIRRADAGSRLTAAPDPTSIDVPTFDEVAVVLAPKCSPELGVWINAARAGGMRLADWENFVADHAAEIDTSDGPDATTVLSDAQNWTTEVRVIRKRVKDAEEAETQDGEEVIAKATNRVLQSFKVRVPVLEFGDTYNVVIRIDRDVPNSTIRPAVPGCDRLLREAKQFECDTALGLLGMEAIA